MRYLTYLLRTDGVRSNFAPLAGLPCFVRRCRMLFGPARVTPSFTQWSVWMALRPGQRRASAADVAMMIPTAMHMAGRYGELRMPVTIPAGVAGVAGVVKSRHCHGV